MMNLIDDRIFQNLKESMEQLSKCLKYFARKYLIFDKLASDNRRRFTIPF